MSEYAYGTTTTIQIVAHWCDHPNGCGIAYGLPRGFIEARQKDHKTWTCPNGCKAHYPRGKSDEQKLREAAVRETHLQDQTRAAIRDAEEARRQLLRDRARFANGVCVCCNRNFQNVADHMRTQHPDYVAQHHVTVPPVYRCTCGSKFDTFRGLRVHQGRLRGDEWDKPETPAGWTWGGSHLTEVGSR